MISGTVSTSVCVSVYKHMLLFPEGSGFQAVVSG